MNLRARLAAVGLALVGLAPQPALAHERDADRRVILDVEDDTVVALVAWTLPAGADADRIRSLADASGDGVVRAPMEQLTRAMLVVPRMLDGLVIRVDGVVVEGAVIDLHVRDSARDGPRRGLEAMALLDVPMRDALADHTATIELVFAHGEGHLRFEAQARGAAAITGGSLADASRSADPVLGPAQMHAGDTESIEITVASAR